jgi:hypothetical protein
MFFTHPGSLISDPGSKNSNKREGRNKICCHTCFCSHKFHKIENYFIFEILKKKNWASFQRIIELFTQKFTTELSKIWVWNPGSGIKTYSGSWIHVQGSKRHLIPDPGSRSATLPNSISKNYEKTSCINIFYLSSASTTPVFNLYF